MSIFSKEVRSHIEKHGKEIRVIQQRGFPFKLPPGIPLPSLSGPKQMLFKAQYKVNGVSLEEAREGLLFASYRKFMDMKMETFSRKSRTRHFKINPFAKKFEEVLGGPFGQVGLRIGRSMANGMVNRLGLVEWEVSEDPVENPDLVSIHVKVTSKYFRGHFKFRVHRVPDGVIIDDDWTIEGGGSVQADSLPMANLVLTTHPLGFEQIVERIVEEVLAARSEGRPYVGEIGPPSEEIA